jgi:hypothetical protein
MYYLLIFSHAKKICILDGSLGYIVTIYNVTGTEYQRPCGLMLGPCPSHHKAVGECTIQYTIPVIHFVLFWLGDCL